MQEKHSGLGIASFAISVIVGIAIFLLILAAGVMETAVPGGMSENQAAAVIVGLLIIGLLLVDVVALGLGIAALLQKDRKKLFSVLGVSFSGVTVLGTVALIIIGNLMK